MYHVREDFLSDRALEELQTHLQSAEFADYRSPVDGVTYPHICSDVPQVVQAEVEFLSGTAPNFLFLRRMPAGVTAPNPVHTDNSMGRTSFMLYLSQTPPGVADGTAFLRHRTLGVAFAPQVEELARLCREDADKPQAWHPHTFVQARVNRACIFESGWFHRAEPAGGYGEGATARTVLSAFFD